MIQLIPESKHEAHPKFIEVKRKERRVGYGSNDNEVDAGSTSGKPWTIDASSTQDIGSKSPKITNFPQMLLSDSKLKRSKLMTRRESQALLEGVRKNRGVQSTQSCNN